MWTSTRTLSLASLVLLGTGTLLTLLCLSGLIKKQSFLKFIVQPNHLGHLYRYGVEAHLADVDLGDTKMEALAHLRAEGVEECDHHTQDRNSMNPSDGAEEKKSEDVDVEKLTYEQWIQAAQAGRNANWKFNVTFQKEPDTPVAPSFPHNTLFHSVVEDYAMKNTSVASANVQIAAKKTVDSELFAPCMVGTLESQFLKLQAKTIKARRVLDIEPTSIHQRTPLVVGSRVELADFERFVISGAGA